MPAELFVDTSGWYPIAVRDHPDHEPLAAALRERVTSGWRVVTTNLVVAETHALLLRRVGRGAALDFVREARRDPLLVVDSTSDLEHDAIRDWLVPYDDQRFSLVDAVSFAVMAGRGISDVLALDRHFTTAGFNRVS